MAGCGGVAVAAPGPDVRTRSGPTVADTGPHAQEHDPRQLYREDFEHGTGARPVSLEDYVGAAGERYTADPFWLNAAQCNGIVLRHDSSPSACPDAVAEKRLRALASALGRASGTPPEQNHVISAYTLSVPGPANAVQAASVDAVRLPEPGRFVSFGVTAGAASCTEAAHPRLSFKLVDQGAERPVADRPIDPCSDQGAVVSIVDGQRVAAGKFVSAGGLLFRGDAVKWVLRNETGTDVGNDGAFDDVTVYDSTPVLENAFASDDLVVGDGTRLTLTVRNTSEYGAKPGWSFTEALPSGLSLAQDPDAATTCGGGVDAAGGGSEIRVHGDLAPRSVSCTVSVDVTASMAGTYTVDSSSVVDRLGVDLPAPASVTFVAEQTGITVTEVPELTGGSDPADGVADIGEQIAFRQHVTNTGNTAVHDLAVTSDAGPVTCDAHELAAGASTDCSTGPRDVTQQDVDAGSIDDHVVATATSRQGTAVSAEARAGQPTADQHAGTGLVLRAEVDGDALPAVGDAVALRIAVRNQGNVTLSALAVRLLGLDGMPVSCPPGPLAPGATVSCTVSGRYTVTQADVDAGSVVFRAASQATGPKGQHVTAEATASQATAAQAPAVGTSVVAELGDSQDDVIAGRPVTIGVTVVNTGNVTLREVSSTLLPEATVTCPASELAPGGSMRCRVPDHELTQEELDAGHFDVATTATATGPAGQTVTASDDTRVDLHQRPALATVVSPHLAASEHEVPAAGDRIVAAATVTNTGNVTVRSLVEELDGHEVLTCDTTELAPAATATCGIADHVVTQVDLDRGSVPYAVVATGAAPGGADVRAEDAVTVGLEAQSGLVLTAEWSPSAHPLHPGDRVDPAFRLRNTSNVTIRQAVVSGDRLGPVTCDIAVLTPGESAPCRAEHGYRVTAGDAARGSFELEARGRGDAPRADGPPPSGTGERAVQVVSNPVRATFHAEPIPAVAPRLAFTGSEVFVVGGSAAAALLCSGLGLVAWSRRRARTYSLQRRGTSDGDAER